MRKHLLFLVLAAGMAGPSHAREVPEGVQRIIDSLLADSTMEHGLASAQKWLLVDSSVELGEIEAGTPIEQYHVRYELLDTCDPNAPLMELLEPSNMWYVPIRANGRYLYFVEVYKKKGAWQTIGAGEGDWGIWTELRKTYPESTGINPVLVTYGPRRFLHFPQKGKRNLFNVVHLNDSPNNSRRYREDSVFSRMSYSLDSLDDSRPVVEYMKKRWKESLEKASREGKSAVAPFPRGMGPSKGGANE